MTALTKSRSVVALIRPEVTLAVGACVIAGEILALRNFPPIREAFLGFLTGFFISSAAMVVNDYFDLEVDKVNAPNRPLPSGTVTVSEVILLTAATSMAGLVVAGLLSGLNLAIAAVFWMVGFLYNWKLKETGLAGNMMVSASAAIPFIYGGVAVGDPLNAVVWSFSVIAFLGNLGEEVASGIMDIKGDEQRHVKSVAIVWGKGVATFLSSLLLFSVILISFAPYLLGWLGHVYLVMITLADFVVAYSAVRLLRVRTPEEGRGIIRRLFFGMLLALLAFIVGGLYP